MLYKNGEKFPGSISEIREIYTGIINTTFNTIRIMKFIIFLLLPLFGNSQSKILKYEWTKISGPNQFMIISPDSAITQITNLVAGIYQFELKVTNSYNLSARDTMVLTVNPLMNTNFSASIGKMKKSSY